MLNDKGDFVKKSELIRAEVEITHLIVEFVIYYIVYLDVLLIDI